MKSATSKQKNAIIKFNTAMLLAQSVYSKVQNSCTFF